MQNIFLFYLNITVNYVISYLLQWYVINKISWKKTKENWNWKDGLCANKVKIKKGGIVNKCEINGTWLIEEITKSYETTRQT